jgi:hypothetical protein
MARRHDLNRRWVVRKPDSNGNSKRNTTLTNAKRNGKPKRHSDINTQCNGHTKRNANSNPRRNN